MTRVRLQNISKAFGSIPALRNINLEILPGELFFLLGPSGCGKSTLLRLIAGLHEPSEGRIFFNDRDVTPLGTAQRNAVMCFQSYALWPHLSVRENVRFGLDVRNQPREKQIARVDEVLKLVQMLALADRKPNQLSGGQQQRVALARALAVSPDCLLLDEPLSNLDAKLRGEMRSEIRRICKSAGFTTIYVTHDQKEALSIADRIAILKDGQIMQVGTPAQLYNSPASSFVADFIGQANLIPGNIIGRDGEFAKMQTDVGTLFGRMIEGDGQRWMFCVRPENVQIVAFITSGSTALPTGSYGGMNVVRGRIIESTFFGESTEVVMQAGIHTLRLSLAGPLPDEGRNELDVVVQLSPAHARVIPA